MNIAAAFQNKKTNEIEFSGGAALAEVARSFSGCSFPHSSRPPCVALFTGAHHRRTRSLNSTVERCPSTTVAAVGVSRAFGYQETSDFNLAAVDGEPERGAAVLVGGVDSGAAKVQAANNLQWHLLLLLL
jgi:hypothetical protein